MALTIKENLPNRLDTHKILTFNDRRALHIATAQRVGRESTPQQVLRVGGLLGQDGFQIALVVHRAPDTADTAAAAAYPPAGSLLRPCIWNKCLSSKPRRLAAGTLLPTFKLFARTQR